MVHWRIRSTAKGTCQRTRFFTKEHIKKTAKPSQEKEEEEAFFAVCVIFQPYQQSNLNVLTSLHEYRKGQNVVDGGRKATSDPHQERLPFAWNFRVGFLGQMEQFISSGKNRSKTTKLSSVDWGD